MAYLAGVPSHKWLGYFHKIFAKRGDSDGLQCKERRDKDLWGFFFVIFAFFVVNPALVAAARAAALRQISG